MEKAYKARFETQAKREKELQARLEALTNQVDSLTKELARERGTRLKLETEYT